MLVRHKKNKNFALILKEDDQLKGLCYELLIDGKIILSTIYYWEVV